MVPKQVFIGGGALKAPPLSMSIPEAPYGRIKSFRNIPKISVSLSDNVLLTVALLPEIILYLLFNT